MERLADFRRVFSEIVVARAGCARNAALSRAFATVPRHDFIGSGPWVVREDGGRTETDDPALADRADVRSLRLDAPDETAWFVGEGWSLS